MDGMKKLIVAVGGILVAVAVFAILLNVTKADLQNQVKERGGTSSASNSSSRSADNNNPESTIEQDVIFFTYYKNSSNTNVSGYYVDKNGNKLEYELTGNVLIPDAEEVFQKTYSELESYERQEFMPLRDAENLFDVAKTINPDGEFSTENNDTSEGTTTVYAVVYNDSKPSILKIFSSGDLNEIPADRNAEIIRSYFLKLQNEEKGF